MYAKIYGLNNYGKREYLCSKPNEEKNRTFSYKGLCSGATLADTVNQGCTVSVERNKTRSADECVLEE